MRVPAAAVLPSKVTDGVQRFANSASILKIGTPEHLDVPLCSNLRYPNHFLLFLPPAEPQVLPRLRNHHPLLHLQLALPLVLLRTLLLELH